MSERTPRIQPETLSADPKLDLSDLTASSRPVPVVAEPQHTTTPETDLSKVSIALSDVPRASTRLERRPDIEGRLRENNLNSKPRTDRHRIDRSRHGILRNPYFRYQGNPLVRFITLLANILKFLEQLLLGKLSGPKTPPQRQMKPQTPPQQPMLDPKIIAEKERKEARERAEKNSLRVHRS